MAAQHAEVKGFQLVRRIGPISVRKYCVGKLFLAAAIQTLQFLSEWRGQPRLRNEYCTKFLISGFSQMAI